MRSLLAPSSNTACSEASQTPEFQREEDGEGDRLKRCNLGGNMVLLTGHSRTRPTSSHARAWPGTTRRSYGTANACLPGNSNGSTGSTGSTRTTGRALERVLMHLITDQAPLTERGRYDGRIDWHLVQAHATSGARASVGPNHAGPAIARSGPATTEMVSHAHVAATNHTAPLPVRACRVESERLQVRHRVNVTAILTVLRGVLVVVPDGLLIADATSTTTNSADAAAAAAVAAATTGLQIVVATADGATRSTADSSASTTDTTTTIIVASASTATRSDANATTATAATATTTTAAAASSSSATITAAGATAASLVVIGVSAAAHLALALVPAVLGARRSRRHVHRGALDQVVLAAQALRHVTNANARNGFGMNTSVTSPYLLKYSWMSSEVMSSVTRPRKILLGIWCCIWSLLLGTFTSHQRLSIRCRLDSAFIWHSNLANRMNPSPKLSKYSRSPSSVVFQGSPSTIRSVVVRFRLSMRFVFGVEFSSLSSLLRLFSFGNTQIANQTIKLKHRSGPLLRLP
uniref:Uncharacterized protein n=1 Tax=Anopheles atroparvus TaxID=41427 RepID=A0A182J536_ANOAO